MIWSFVPVLSLEEEERPGHDYHFVAIETNFLSFVI
jgi:hypothetical protein